MQRRTRDGQILLRRDPLLEGAVDPDPVLVRGSSHLEDRARVRQSLEGERLDLPVCVEAGELQETKPEAGLEPTTCSLQVSCSTS
jgi:hypothetical protein